MSNRNDELSTKTKIISVAFLMATTSVGPGFLTQNTTFINLFKENMVLPIMIAIIFTFGIMMNLWRVIGVSGMRIQDMANNVFPKLGFVIGILLALGAVAFNFGNISGSGLGINVLTDLPQIYGVWITGILGVLLFIAHNATRYMDQMARYMGLLMIIMIAYVAIISLPSFSLLEKGVVNPENVKSLLLPTLVIIGGIAGGYYTGAQRLVDIGLKGKENVGAISKAAWLGMAVAVGIQIMLFLAVLGVVSQGKSLGNDNPAAEAFRLGAGNIGYYFFGFVLFFASITSVVGNSYMAISLVKTLFPIIAKHERLWCVFFIIITTIGTAVISQPRTLLLTAGLVNSIILPIILLCVMIASRKKSIIGDYKHSVFLTVLGYFIAFVMLSSIPFNIFNFIKMFI